MGLRNKVFPILDAVQPRVSRIGGTTIYRLPLFVFTIALAVRILFLFSPPVPEWKPDSSAYDNLAIRLLDGKGYVNADGEATSSRPPGYSLFLSTVYWPTGRSLGAVRMVQAVLDAITCLMVYVLARRMFGARVALIATGFSIFSLGQIYASRLILAETLVTFLLVLAVLLLHKGLARPNRFALVGAGVVFGLGTLTKGTVLLSPFLVGWVIWRASQNNARAALRQWAVVILCFGLTLLPWIVRNYFVHNRFVPVTTKVGRNVYCGYHPFQGKIFGVCDKGEPFRRIVTTLPEAEQTRAFLTETFHYVSKHPSVIPKVTLLKFFYFISPIDWELLPGAGVINFTFVFTAPFAVYGLWLARRGGWQVSLLVTIALGFLLTAILAETGPRYRLPIEPLMSIFSGLGLAEMVHRLDRHRLFVLSGISVYLGLTFAFFVFSDQVRSVARFLLGSIGLW